MDPGHVPGAGALAGTLSPLGRARRTLLAAGLRLLLRGGDEVRARQPPLDPRDERRSEHALPGCPRAPDRRQVRGRALGRAPAARRIPGTGARVGRHDRGPARPWLPRAGRGRPDQPVVPHRRRRAGDVLPVPGWRGRPAAAAAAGVDATRPCGHGRARPRPARPGPRPAPARPARARIAARRALRGAVRPAPGAHRGPARTRTGGPGTRDGRRPSATPCRRQPRPGPAAGRPPGDGWRPDGCRRTPGRAPERGRAAPAPGPRRGRPAPHARAHRPGRGPVERPRLPARDPQWSGARTDDPARAARRRPR